MAITTIQDAVTTLAEMSTEYEEVQTRLSTDEPSRENLSAILAALQTLLTTARTLRTDLQTVDEASLIAVQDGERLIRVWQWARRTRFALQLLIASMKETADTTALILSGFTVRIVVVGDGDTLQDIAARELGDWREWPKLVEANPGTTPGALATGDRLTIPSAV